MQRVAASAGDTRRGVDLGHVNGQVDDALGVTPLVVVPGDKLHEVRGQRDACLSVEDGAVAVVNEVAADHGGVRVTQDATQLVGL